MKKNLSKKWLLLLMAIGMVFAVSACSSEEEKPAETKKEEVKKEEPKKVEGYRGTDSKTEILYVKVGTVDIKRMF